MTTSGIGCDFDCDACNAYGEAAVTPFAAVADDAPNVERIAERCRCGELRVNRVHFETRGSAFHVFERDALAAPSDGPRRERAMSQPATEAGRALLKYRDDAWETNLAHNIAVVERQAAAKVRADLIERVRAMDAYHPHEAPYVGGSADLPCVPKACPGGMRLAVLALLRDDKEA